MNAKTNQLTIMFICFFGFALVGCGNSSSKQQTERTAQQENPLLKIFKETFDKKESFFELIRKDSVKERIINDYSPIFYDKLCQEIQVSSPISYADGKYEGYGTGGRYGSGEAYLSYNPANDILTINFTIGGETIQRDGEVYYNTEGWELKYRTDEFDEDIKSQPMAYYSLMADYDLVPYADIWVLAFWNGVILLCTNDFGYSSISIDKILIKDNDSGKIYNLAFNDKYHQAGGGAMYDDIGVAMWGENATQFMNIVTSLTDYSISFINESGENRVVKNPKNLCNIEDAIKKFIVNNTNE